VNPLETLQAALTALMDSKLRSTLTVLGVIIGVAAVIGVMSIGQGAQVEITNRIERLGTDMLFVRPGAATDEGVRGEQGTAQSLTMEDAFALTDQERAPDVLLVAPEVRSGRALRLAVGSENASVPLFGTTPDWAHIRNAQVAEGRFITEEDVRISALVMVMGANTAKTLFGISSPVGQVVRMNNAWSFTVVGVLQEGGGTGLGLLDDIAILPISAVQYRLGAARTARGEFRLNNINIRAMSSDRMAAAKEQVVAILRQRHGIGEADDDDFTVTSQEELRVTFNQVASVFTIFLGSIAGISLLVGGIGIMNIMLVSVTERTREIGIRKAVGAKRGDILRQFLAEAVALSFVGGALGIALGWALSRGFSRISFNDQTIQTVITPDSVVLAVSVAVAIGLFFGLYPAVRASTLDPIEALRHE
jgi:putative ABC transport system permease protein